MSVVDGFVLFMWVLGALSLLGSVGYRIYNVFSFCEAYGWKGFWINFIIGLVGYGFLFVGNMILLESAVSLYSVFLTWLLLLGILLWIAELLILFGKMAKDGMERNYLKENVIKERNKNG